MSRDILSVLASTWTKFLELAAQFLPRLLAMLVIVVAGWFFAYVTRAIVRRLLRIKRLAALFEKSGTAELLRRADAPLPDALLSGAVFWLVWFGFLLAGLHALGFAGTEPLVADLVRFVPKLFVAAIILVAGIGISNFLWRATLVAAVNARLPAARLLGALVRVLAFAATVATALEQLDVASQVVRMTFTITFGAVMLAGAIAFGFGGRGLARRFLEEKLRRDEPPKDEPPHV
jgi:hypothetical protein